MFDAIRGPIGINGSRGDEHYGGRDTFKNRRQGLAAIFIIGVGL